MKYHTKNKVKIFNCLKANSDKHLTIEQIDELLDDNSERTIVSCKAPANGLTLVRVNYENL